MWKCKKIKENSSTLSNILESDFLWMWQTKVEKFSFQECEIAFELARLTFLIMFQVAGAKIKIFNNLLWPKSAESLKRANFIGRIRTTFTLWFADSYGLLWDFVMLGSTRESIRFSCFARWDSILIRRHLKSVKFQ